MIEILYILEKNYWKSRIESWHHENVAGGGVCHEFLSYIAYKNTLFRSKYVENERIKQKVNKRDLKNIS